MTFEKCQIESAEWYLLKKITLTLAENACNFKFRHTIKLSLWQLQRAEKSALQSYIIYVYVKIKGILTAQNVILKKN